MKINSLQCVFKFKCSQNKTSLTTKGIDKGKNPEVYEHNSKAHKGKEQQKRLVP